MTERQSGASGEGPEYQAMTGMGMFPFLDSGALHDEYTEAARRGGQAGPPKFWLTVTLALVALLVAVAAAQTASNANADAQQRSDLVNQITARKANVRNLMAQVTATQNHINILETGLASNRQLSGTTRSRLASWGTWAGVSAVSGPGIEVRVNNAPGGGTRGVVLDRDLQQLANGLWEAGAEAMAINGERITGLTSIRLAGSAITVNYQSLTPPYVIEAIGDPATLPTKFAATDSGAAWLDLQAQAGMLFAMDTKSVVTLKAATLPALRFARPVDASGGTGP